MANDSEEPQRQPACNEVRRRLSGGSRTSWPGRFEVAAIPDLANDSEEPHVDRETSATASLQRGAQTALGAAWRCGATLWTSCMALRGLVRRVYVVIAVLFFFRMRGRNAFAVV